MHFATAGAGSRPVAMMPMPSTIPTVSADHEGGSPREGSPFLSYSYDCASPRGSPSWLPRKRASTSVPYLMGTPHSAGPDHQHLWVPWRKYETSPRVCACERVWVGGMDCPRCCKPRCRGEEPGRAAVTGISRWECRWDVMYRHIYIHEVGM